MITYAHYLKSSFINHEVNLHCFNGDRLSGILQKVYASFLVVKVENKPLTIPLNNVCYIKKTRSQSGVSN